MSDQEKLSKLHDRVTHIEYRLGTVEKDAEKRQESREKFFAKAYGAFWALLTAGIGGFITWAAGIFSKGLGP